MQTLRKLPITAPNSAPTSAASVDSPTRHLVEENARGHRDVQGLGPFAERNADPALRPGGERRTDTLPLVPDHDCEGRATGVLGRGAIHRGQNDSHSRRFGPAAEPK